ncbi:hypothetical protein ACFZBM_02580 [Streptomyces lavendulae]|uniref:Uncharacterized protein n=1 Tax=Streptomyces lavendulae subsp. lavendulae TaxID=58340 RepID=A0A2K8P8B4_STRLA|nr:hypothetical protein [Streptomyces lavendulae]ATZ22956.1 hypothetical protein SLAV_05255 [Streptomyces lavendulae subsp. lavendulae]QUQ52798.1 hypothetical protein SLLC_03295 [Streptomyces lavendulae subsp. lavendulae]
MDPVKAARRAGPLAVCSVSATPADSTSSLHQELTVADPAFVVTTVAVFALVALIARGVTKL